MDIREVPFGNMNRHPWEISKTTETIKIITEYFAGIHDSGQNLIIADIGAGDMYFDKEYLERFPDDTIYAIDNEYKSFSSGCKNLYMAQSIEELNEVNFDAVVLMNLMEYIQDEREFLENLTTRMHPGGTLIFILPAFQFLFSEHDRYVKGLRRYSIKRFKKILKDVKGIELQVSFYFYSTLFLVRAIKKVLHIPTDKDQRNVPVWKYPRNHCVTKVITALLNADYRIWRFLQQIGLKIPELSMFAICKRI